MAKFGKPERHWTGSPWQDNQEVLGLVVGPEDFEPESSWEGYETLTWSKEQICAVFKNNVVQSLIVRPHARAESGRGLWLGDNETKMERLYPEKPEIVTADAPRTTGRGLRKSASWVKVYRYNKLGMGFEIRDEKVVSMCLFPPHAD